MTYEDAKWRLKFERDRVCNECDPLGHGCSSACDFCDTREAYNVAVKSLGKHVPRKPRVIKIKYANATAWYPTFCPVCYDEGSRELWECLIDKGTLFCRRCGQAIDWSEEE